MSAYATRHPCRFQPPRTNTNTSSSSSSTLLRGCWKSVVVEKHSSSRLRAIADGSMSDFDPQQQPSPNRDSTSSSWGSSWGKRSGSVFKKQKKSKGSQQQTNKQHQSSTSSRPRQPPAAAEGLDPQLEASIRMNVERANQTLQDIVQEVLGELLVEEASAYVLGQQEADLQLNQAVRGAVVKRLEWLDSNFLAAVNAFLAVPGVRSDPELSALLQAIRQETLQLVAARLPAPVQVLNTALALSRRAERDRVVQQALSGGRGDVPGTTLDALGAAAHQLIDDMEDQQVVADRVLLARLVLLHEELRALAERQSAQPFWQDGGDATEPAGSSTSGSSMGGGATAGSSQQPFFAFHRSNLPARCAAFLKNLLTVQERNKRLGLLNKTFQEDWIAEQGQPSAATAAGSGSKAGESEQQSFSKQRAQMRDTNFGPEQKQEAPDIVRPGRLLTTLHAMRQELEVQLVSAGADTPAGSEALGLLQRLDDIRVESLVALDRVQHSRPGSLGAAGELGSSSALLDYELEMEEHDAALQGLGQH